jgi:hypothetical protein
MCSTPSSGCSTKGSGNRERNLDPRLISTKFPVPAGRALDVSRASLLNFGVSDILFRSDASGDTGFYAISNGVNVGWSDVGGSSTAYNIVGTGDFYSTGTTDILYRSNASGDTGFYQISNGANIGWHDIGTSSTAYSVVATGNYLGSGTSDILFRDNTTGDTGFYAISNGVNTGWHDIGTSSTAYHVTT